MWIILTITFTLNLFSFWKPKINDKLFFPQFCDTAGGNLAEISDEHEQKALEQFLVAIDPYVQKFFWIGLTDLFSEGNFTWLPSGTKASYLNWRENQDSGVGENFVFLWKERKWADCVHDCHITQKINIYALCEKDF